MSEISGTTFLWSLKSLITACRWISDLQLLCRASSRGGSKMGTGNLGQGTGDRGDRELGGGNWNRQRTRGRELG